ncbi:unnamed protein product [Cyprideis torosa]|uniref:Uncharacterized protein n=1 Tax=Cyprideis torosa TaxID=163714 RepID=A0A7R8ZPA3_9CRUS|nr:unnamed protein product [Cyprideis torosa]CAG0893507.1 unnamed protein product [Cyprideis torosa]
MVIRRASVSRWVPRDGIGMAWIHSLLSARAAALILAVKTYPEPEDPPDYECSRDGIPSFLVYALFSRTGSSSVWFFYLHALMASTSSVVPSNSTDDERMVSTREVVAWRDETKLGRATSSLFLSPRPPRPTRSFAFAVVTFESKLRSREKALKSASTVSTGLPMLPSSRNQMLSSDVKSLVASSTPRENSAGPEGVERSRTVVPGLVDAVKRLLQLRLQGKLSDNRSLCLDARDNGESQAIRNPQKKSVVVPVQPEPGDIFRGALWINEPVKNFKFVVLHSYSVVELLNVHVSAEDTQVFNAETGGVHVKIIVAGVMRIQYKESQVSSIGIEVDA